MARRTYNQFCGLSRSLDIVGERWTLLIVREFMSGPKRYTDLADVLRGVGTTLLATRIRQLEQDGIVVRRTLPPPAASQVYELTPVGHELAQALVPLAIWGIRHQLGGTRLPGETYRAEWTLVFLAELIDAGPVSRSTRDLPVSVTVLFFDADLSTAEVRIEGGQDAQAGDSSRVLRAAAAELRAIAERLELDRLG
jgi:DNA-binding HxlR family transcriptional regulator